MTLTHTYRQLTLTNNQPLHSVVFLSRMALVLTILPYLKDMMRQKADLKRSCI